MLMGNDPFSVWKGSFHRAGILTAILGLLAIGALLSGCGSNGAAKRPCVLNLQKHG